MTGQIWTFDFRQKNHLFFVNERKSFKWKKNYDHEPYFYISKKLVKFQVNSLNNFRVIVVTDLKNVVLRKTYLKF